MALFHCVVRLGSVQNDMAQFGSVCVLSWQFLSHSHQSRDKFTFSLLKGFILCREGQQSTETHTFSAECDRGVGGGGGVVLLRHISTQSRLQGYNRAAVLFLS